MHLIVKIRFFFIEVELSKIYFSQRKKDAHVYIYFMWYPSIGDTSHISDADLDRNETRPERDFCNFAWSLAGPAELPSQYNEICIEISLKKKEKKNSLIDASNSVRKGYQFLPDGGSAQIDIKRIAAFLLRKYHISNLTCYIILHLASISISNLHCFVIDPVSEITIDLLLSAKSRISIPDAEIADVKNRKTVH